MREVNDVNRELREHLDMLVEDLMATGMTREAAMAEATRRFGDVDPVARECVMISRRASERARRADYLLGVADDIRHASRAVLKSPLLTIVVSLTLMLGIGATSAVFSVVDQILLRPLAYPASAQLVAVRDDPRSMNPLDFPEYEALRQTASGTFSDLGAWFSSTLTLTGVAEPTVLRGDRLSASMTRILGVRPILGRAFTEADDSPVGDRTIMLSEACWRRVFNADPTVVGRVLTLEGLPFTVIGVYPSNASTMLPTEITSGRHSDYWQGFRLSRERAPLGTHFLSVVGRVRPRLSIDAVNANLRAIADRLHSASLSTHTPIALSLTERVVGPLKRMLAMFLVAAVLVLLIACANVAGLLIARVASRRRELAVRAAIGASGGRIATQLVAESVLRAFIGGALGVALSYVLLGALRRASVLHLPRIAEVHVDLRLITFAVALSILTGLICGALPALWSRRFDLGSALRDGGRCGIGGIGADRFRRALVVLEISLSFALLVGTGLLLESFQRLLHVEKGFDPDNVVAAVLNLSNSRYPDGPRQLAVYEQILAGVRAIPAVRAAALTSSLPIEGGTDGGVAIEGKTFPANDEPVAEKRVVSTGYFEALGAHIAAGRFFTSQDASGGATAAIVNATFARRFLDSTTAVGRRVGFQWGTDGMQTVVGVVNDVREGALNDSPRPAIYVPLQQRPSSSMYLVVRSSADPTSIIPAIRRVVLSIDGRLALSDVRLMKELIESGAASQRSGSALLALFSIAALTLAAIGLYGVVSYAVLQRMREFGVRAALGASRGSIVRLVMTQAAQFIVAGLLLGVLIARTGARFLQEQLFGVTAGAVEVYAGVAALLVVVAVVAALIPSHRASRADPLVALRAE